MRRGLLLGMILAAIFAVFPVWGSQYYVYLNTEVLITILYATSLNLLVGYTGLFSLGHAGFFGIGAYAFSILFKKFGVAFWISFAIAPFCSAVVAIIIGYFCIRLTKLYFAMLTLAGSQIIWAIAFKWNALTGGDTGMTNIMPPDYILGLTPTYYFTLIVVGILLISLLRIVSSPFGLITKTIRENPHRTLFIGVSVKRHQLMVFTLAGFYAGCAGVLYIISTHAIFPDVILARRSIEGVVMCILGGMYNFLGPALGATIIIFLNNFVTAYTEYWSLFLGGVLAILLFFFPNGILGITETAFSKYAKRAKSNASS